MLDSDPFGAYLGKTLGRVAAGYEFEEFLDADRREHAGRVPPR